MVLNTPAATLTDFTKHTDAVLLNFWSGEKMAEALINVMVGDVNPSGKLPITLPNNVND